MQLHALAEGQSPLCVQVPQNGRFMTTPWTVDVDPRSPLPDYPRPQLQRQQWLNLNGIWQFEAGGWVPAVGSELYCCTASSAQGSMPFALSDKAEALLLCGHLAARSWQGGLYWLVFSRL